MKMDRNDVFDTTMVVLAIVMPIGVVLLRLNGY